MPVLFLGSGKLILRKRLECKLMLKRGTEDKNHNDEDVKSYTVCLLLRNCFVVVYVRIV